MSRFNPPGLPENTRSIGAASQAWLDDGNIAIPILETYWIGWKEETETWAVWAQTHPGDEFDRRNPPDLIFELAGVEDNEPEILPIIAEHWESRQICGSHIILFDFIGLSFSPHDFGLENDLKDHFLDLGILPP